MPRLRIKIKDEFQDIIVEGKSFIIGRAHDSDYPIPSGYISRKHAEIRLEPEGYTIRDLGSKMGTWLNDHLLEGVQPLNLGDTIKFANRIEAVFMSNVAIEHTETLVAQKQELVKDSERLVATNGPLAGREFPLYLNLTRIGRGDDNHIHIPVDTVSTYHAEITQESDGYVLSDLDSGNGSYVNGEKIKRRQLKPGDTIDIDWVSFRFESIHYRMNAGGTRIKNELVKEALPDDYQKPSKSYINKTLAMEAQPEPPSGRHKLATAKERSKMKDTIAGALILLLSGGIAALAWYYLIRPFYN